MPLRDPALDHAVVNVRDQMDRAVELYRRLGFHMTERGYHTLGSINHLAVLERDYIELIRFEPNAANVRTDSLRYPCGLNALVFGMSEANSVYAELQNSDVPAEPPVAFSRPVPSREAIRTRVSNRAASQRCRSRRAGVLLSAPDTRARLAPRVAAPRQWSRRPDAGRACFGGSAARSRDLQAHVRRPGG